MMAVTTVNAHPSLAHPLARHLTSRATAGHKVHVRARLNFAGDYKTEKNTEGSFMSIFNFDSFTIHLLIIAA